MPRIAIQSGPLPLNVEMGSSLRQSDDELFRLCLQNPELRLDELPREVKTRFLPLAPDFVVELRSPSDDLRNLQAKMEEYLGVGVRLGWLIHPAERRVHVYRPDRPLETREDPPEISGDPELPGFVLELAQVWEPI